MVLSDGDARTPKDKRFAFSELIRMGRKKFIKYIYTYINGRLAHVAPVQ